VSPDSAALVYKTMSKVPQKKAGRQQK